ncbi:3f88b514-e7f5-4fc2-a817-29437a5c5545-CDS [Sclerotinia trifoliorum]|uniref:3f88b514-e7f5-4fc2-a817-29437a5c5545-CDS n=1 Tax=Sclerotinia trifoliorum TaxID=28548 RepID=A0A8H2VVH0_9HELO|nr:3f88b514-e7f5-4fc2-a817-29437a5c5545-CDS [Sclerotinia trifoliorum]
MDEATRLVGELSKKLTELDHKVDLYRKDMNKEFIKYEEDLLKNVSPNLSKEVSTIIAERLKNYKALYPFVSPSSTNNNPSDNFDSCAIGTGTGPGLGTTNTGTAANNNSHSSCNTTTATATTTTTNTITSSRADVNLMTNGLPKAMNSPSSTGTSAQTIPNHTRKEEEESDRPRSPHAREKEFTGVFTPSYLPLLESNSRYDPRSDPNIEVDNQSKDTQMDTSSQSHVDASTDTRSLNPSPDLTRPSTPKRKNTDEISITSNSSSDGPRRRSALRRTSSNSKNTSPRRVRFDVEGEEVLPTSSPKELEPILPPSFSDDSDDEAGSEMVEDIDAPPPKRISSSQALRALSRGPPEDDGTQWTTVVAPPDGSASVDTLENDDSTNNYFDSGPSPPASRDENTPPISTPIPIQITMPEVEPQAQVKHVEALPEDTDALSEDDMLDMPPLRQMRSQNQQPARILSPRKNENPEPAISALKIKSPNKPLTLETLEPRGESDEKLDNLTFQDDEQEDLFSFDENPDRGSRPQDEEDDSDVEAPTSPSVEESLDNLELSKSPARPIPHSFINNKATIAPAPAHGVVGSYKGRPFSMPVVNDEVHANAASMGAMNSFVGSVNGRSGLDASDILSFRTSGGVGSFSGTPKSMSERMMMDDLIEAEGENQKS